MRTPDDGIYEFTMKTRTCSAEKDKHSKDFAQNGSTTSVHVPDDTWEKPGKDLWINLLFIFPTNILLGIDFMFYPMYYVELVRYFSIPTAQVGWPSSIHQAVTLIFGIFLTAPVEIYGCRAVAMVGGVIVALGIGLSFFANSIITLSLTYGLLSGIGVSMLILANMVVLQQSFYKNRSVAASIGLCGLNVGNGVGPMWVEYLINTFGWRGGFLLQSGLMLQATVIATQYRPTSQKSPQSEPRKEGQNATLRTLMKDVLNFSLLKERSFALYGLAVFLLRLMNDGSMTVLANSVVFYGGTRQQAATIIAIVYCLYIVSRLINGFLAKLSCANTVVMFGVSTVIAGCGMILLAPARDFTATASVMGSYGAAQGCSSMLVFVAIVDIVGVENIARSTALIFAFQGAAALIAPPFSGTWFDLTGNYSITFLVNGGLGVLGGFLILLVYIIERTKRTKLRKVPTIAEKHITQADDDCVT